MLTLKRTGTSNDSTGGLGRISLGCALVLALLMAGCSLGPGLPPVQSNLDLNIRDLPDFAGFKDAQERKDAFVSYLVPVIQAYDERVLLVRVAALLRRAGR